MTEAAEAQPKRGPGRPPGHGVGTYRLNRKRAGFVRAVADGMEPTAAALQAGYRPSNASRIALRLMRVAAIRAAIQESGSEKTELLQQLDAARQMAIATSDAGALVAAISAKCRILGLL